MRVKPLVSPVLLFVIFAVFSPAISAQSLEEFRQAHGLGAVDLGGQPGNIAIIADVLDDGKPIGAVRLVLTLDGHPRCAGCPPSVAPGTYIHVPKDLHGIRPQGLHISYEAVHVRYGLHSVAEWKEKAPGTWILAPG